MKRYICLFTLLLLASVLCTVVVFCDLHASQEEVVLTETVIIGDTAAADGLVATTNANLHAHLFWETVNDIGGGEVTTESRYSVTRDYSYQKVDYAPTFSMQSEIPLGTDFTEALSKTDLLLGEIEALNFDTPLSDGSTFREAATDPALGIVAAYNALYMDAPIGEEVSAIVRVADYYDYYPINLDVSIPGVYWTNNDYDENDVARGTEHYVTKQFRDFFKIPVMQDEMLEIHLTRNARGGMSWGSASAGSGLDGNATFSLRSLSAISDEHVYVTFNPERTDGSRIDTSEIPGGFGIYRVSYEEGDGYYKENIGMTGDDLAMVYALPVETRIRDLYINEAKTHLLLVTEAENAVTVDIISCATMEKTQSFTVPVSAGGYYSQIRIFDTYSVIVTSDTLTVLSEENGVYTKAFTAARTGEDDLRIHMAHNAAMDFDGERLAVAYPLMSGFHYSVSGYWVAVYTKDGCTFLATYDSSLDAGKNGTWSSDFDTDGWTEVRWE